MDVVDAQDVVAGAADQAVRVGAAVEEVSARSAIEQVPACFPEQTVVAATPEQVVVAGAAEETIVAGASEQAVIARAAEQLVLAGAPIQQIITLVTEDRVVAGPAEQPIVVRRSVNHVVAVGPGNGRSDAPAGLHAIDDIGAAADPRLLQRPAGAKGDADVSRHDRVAITASRCPVWWRERPSGRSAGGCGQRRRRLGRNRIEHLAAGRCQYRALETFRSQIKAALLAYVHGCGAFLVVAAPRDLPAIGPIGRGLTRGGVALGEQKADQSCGQWRADRETIQIEPRRAAGGDLRSIGRPVRLLVRALRGIRLG